MATAYDDFFKLLQNQQQNTRLDNPYGAASYALSNAVQGFLMGRDRKHKRDASEALAAAMAGGGGEGLGGLLSGQVAGFANGGGLPDYEGVKKALSGLKGNPYASEMLQELTLGDLKETAKTRNKLLELGFEGEVDKDVYRDRRLADAGYIGQEYGLKSQLSNQEYRQRVDEAERQSGLDLTKIRTQHTLDNERTLNEIEARLGADLTRSEANVWEHGAKSNIDVDKFRQQEGIETQQLGIRGEAELDRRRRELGFQTDEALREKRGSVNEDIRKKQEELAAETASAATGFFTSKSVEGDIARNIVTIGPRILAGEEVTPQERAAYNFSIQKATEPKTIESNGQIITIPGMTPDQIFQGIGMAAMQRQAAPPATEALGPSSVAPYSRDALLSAIIRQESGGNPRARSPVGARGLMQLMPATAMEVVREMGIRNFKIDWLDNPEINQKLGTYYLDKQLKAYNGNVPMALAAYNAGPGAVNKWRQRYGDPLKGEISVREWVNRIPYKETQGYVRNIMGDLSREAPPSAPATPSHSRHLPPPPVVPQVPQGGAGLPPVPQQIDTTALPRLPQPPPVPQPTVIPVPQSPKAQAQEAKAVADARKAEIAAAEAERAAEQGRRASQGRTEILQNSVGRVYDMLDRGVIPSRVSDKVLFQMQAHVPGTEANQLANDFDMLKEQVVAKVRETTKGVFVNDDARRAESEFGRLRLWDGEKRIRQVLDNYIKLLGVDAPKADEDLSSMSDDELKKALGL